MKKLIILAMMLGLLMGGCATTVDLKTKCNLYPETEQIRKVAPGQIVVSNRMCVKNQQWRGLVNGGMVVIEECANADILYSGISGETVNFIIRQFYSRNPDVPSVSTPLFLPAKKGKANISGIEIEIVSIVDGTLTYQILVFPGNERCQIKEYTMHPHWIK